MISIQLYTTLLSDWAASETGGPVTSDSGSSTPVAATVAEALLGAILLSSSLRSLCIHLMEQTVIIDETTTAQNMIIKVMLGLSKREGPEVDDDDSSPLCIQNSTRWFQSDPGRYMVKEE